MLAQLLIATLCAEPQRSHQSLRHLNCMLLERMFGVHAHNRIGGVTFTKDAITRIENLAYDDFEAKTIDLRWVPPAVEHLRLANHMAISAVETRMLPKCLQYFSAVRCGIPGTIDLMHLPLSLTELDLKMNNISGTVTLLELPRVLKAINLSQNRIEAVLADGQNIPQDIELFLSDSGEQKVKYIDIDGRERQAFSCIKRGL